MTMRRLPLATLVIVFLCGCRSPLFQEVKPVPLDEVSPQHVRDTFRSLLPIRSRTINTVVFEFHGHDFTVIGYSDIDARAKSFTVVGLHPAAGFKLFEVSGTAHDVECTFAVQDLVRQGNFAQAVAEDIRRIYFDRVPPPGAKISRGKYRLSFIEQTAGGEVRYVFAGAGAVLVEKSYLEKKRKIWTASYYQYRTVKGRLYPGAIILNDFAQGYRLVVRLKEVRS